MSEETVSSVWQTPGNDTRRNTLSLLTTTGEGISEQELISDIDRTIGQWVIYTCLCLTIDICGTVTNILNIICFVKQGFKDPVNVSLLGLTISDLGCLVPLIWTNICLTPSFITSDPPFDPPEFQYLTGGWPHVTFTRVSSWITALITMERCLCVIAPLQVKNIVTSKRVAIIITCVFIILIASVAPVYVVNGIGLKFYPSRNKTVLGLVFTDNREIVDKISFIINNIFLSFSSFVVIIVCTTILVVKLKMHTKWRSKSTTTQYDNVSTRNEKVAKMVIMISTLFIACFIPLVIIFMAITIEPELAIYGKHRNVGFLLVGICVVFESVNSSLNIFIYYHMSSKFRITFRQLFFKKFVEND